MTDPHTVRVRFADAAATEVEMEALAAIVRGFESMPVEARGRTLRYITDRYDGASAGSARRPATPRPSERLADSSGWPR